MVKKIILGGGWQEIFGVIFHMVKINAGDSQWKFFKDYSSYGKKSLPAAAGEHF